jgi:hypothetical protein
MHDREVKLCNGWSTKIGSAFDIHQQPDDWLKRSGSAAMLGHEANELEA